MTARPLRVLLTSFNWVEYLIELGNALARRGHHVDVIWPPGRIRATVQNELGALLDPRVNYHLVTDHPTGLRDPRQLASMARFAWLLRKLRPDVIHLQEATTTFLPLCLRATSAPLVLTIHDVATHPGADSRQPKRRDMVRGHLRERAAAVIVHGESLRRDYLARGASGAPTYSIPHGCYTVFRHWARPDVAEIPSSVLMFGRLHEYKGLPYLLDAAELVAKHVPDFKVLIAGAGSDLDRYADRVNGNPRCIVRRGYLPNERVAEVFQQSQLVVLPYTEASQSGVVRIAYVFGKPVIATNVGALPEAVRDGVTGILVPPADVRALAGAIVALLTDPARRRAMAAAAARMPATEFSWDKIAERTEEVYREALGAPSLEKRTSYSAPHPESRIAP